MVMCQGEGCQIYDFQFFFQNFVVGQLIVYGGRRIFCWVSGEYVVNFGGFQYYIGFNFDIVQVGCGIGGKEWVVGISGEDYYVVVVQQVDCFCLVVVVVYVVQWNGGYQMSVYIGVVECIMYCEVVYDCCQYVYVVVYNVVYICFCQISIMEQVIVINYYVNLNIQFNQFFDFLSYVVKYVCINIEVF